MRIRTTMTNSNLIYIGIAGIGIAVLFTVGMENNLIPVEAGAPFPITACESFGGIYDHWDKIIFITEGASLRDGSGTFIRSGTVLEFKFPQTDPFEPVQLAKLTADHLNQNLGWTNGGFNAINPNRIVIIDVEYTAVCVFPFFPA